MADLNRLESGGVEEQSKRMKKFLEEIREMPIAIHQSDANEQHYEVRTMNTKYTLISNYSQTHL